MASEPEDADVSPRKANGFPKRRQACCVIALVIGAAWLPVLAGFRSVCSWDIYFEHLPFRSFVASSLVRGEWPIWAPGIRGGYPLQANGEGGLLSPLELPLLLLLPPHRAIDAAFVLSSFAAAALAGALARELGATHAGATLSAIAFGLSGRLVCATWPNSAFVTALVPGILLGIQSAARQPSAMGPRIGIALTVGAALLGGRPQTLAVAIPFVAAYAWIAPIWLVPRSKCRQEPSRARLRAYGVSVLVGIGLGVALGAPQALPTWMLSRDSYRGAGLSVAERADLALQGDHFPMIFFPTNARGYWHEARAHVGILTLVVVVGGLWRVARHPGKDSRDRAILAFAVAAGFALLLALGDRTPLFGLLTELPVLRSMRVPARFLVPYSLAVALASGLSLDRLLTEARQDRLRRMLLTGVAVELVVAAWLTVPWLPPKLIGATPPVLSTLRSVRTDASGASPRFLAGEETYFKVSAFARLMDSASKARRALPQLDAVGGNRALLFGLTAVNGYGEPTPQWQENFLVNLTPARLNALGVATVVNASRSEKGEFELRISERPPAELFPRALLVPHAEFVRGPREARQSLDRAENPREVVFLESDRATPFSDGRFFSRPARITHYTPTSVTVDLDDPEDGWLVLFDAWAPGWTAYAANQHLPVLRADGFFRAVRITKGTRRVVFAYRPLDLKIGVTVGLFATAILAYLALRSWRSSRAHTDPVADP